MKRLLRTATLSTLTLLGASLMDPFPGTGTAGEAGKDPKAAAVPEGKAALPPAPDFTLLDLEGKEVTLSDYKGKVVIVDFWATWCGPCRMEIPHFVELRNEWGPSGKFEIIGVSLDRGGPSTVIPFAEKAKINYPVVMGNQEVVTSFGGFRGIPTTYVIDAKGRIYRKYTGYRPKEVFDADVRALLGNTKKGKAPNKETS